MFPIASESKDELTVSAEEVRAELDAVFRSPPFRRAERSRDFLSFISELTLQGDSARINEYLIGSEVFHRGRDYSTAEDSIVRRQALELRQRLDRYYAKEGRNDPIRIELPTGHYVPVFRRQSETLPDSIPRFVPRHLQRFNFRKASLGILAGLAVFSIGWIVGRWPAAQVSPTVLSLDPVAREVWNPWLNDSSGVVICFSNPKTAVVRHSLQQTEPDLTANILPVSSVAEEGFRNVFDFPPGGALYLYPSKVQTKMGEAISAVHLAAFLGRAGVAIQATESRLVNWDYLRKRNFILLGNNQANAWLDPILHKYPFKLGHAQAKAQMPVGLGNRRRHILNTSPLAGEMAEYENHVPKDENEPSQVFALISMIPGLGDGRKLLLINGLDTQVTQMAVEFLTDSKRLANLVSRFRQAAPDHHGPWHFQALIRAEVRDQIPTLAELVAFRVL
ncbi:MAG: hypothetical protein L0387_10650 [Acidobacteria bacterium]|nr:hypothetical protein [Acidobacteriota bacterium]MCI0622109.1 hypothetical protein [Acidobacteriota bacterium]MCI0717922.1 hypothetical protein [Acidobacteriota bacterium]